MNRTTTGKNKEPKKSKKSEEKPEKSKIFDAQNIKAELNELANSGKAAVLQGFFKTGEGDYGEGDVFLGIAVPTLRKIATKYKTLPLKEIENLLNSDRHEERTVALCILLKQYENGDEAQKTQIYDLYLKNRARINNWDLVDISAPTILGDYLSDKDKSILYEWAESGDLWERRMAIMATFHFIRNGHFTDTLKIAEILLGDKEDLIHKAVGWMLREIGKREIEIEEGFLSRHCRTMPRTMLRYAIEKFPKPKRQMYLEGKSYCDY